MSDTPSFKIDVSEKFPHLPEAPAVEAVLDFRARPSVDWKEDAVTNHFTKQLPKYPNTEPMGALLHTVKFDSKNLPKHVEIADEGWRGVKMVSECQKQIAQFRFDGFAFSRLRPYEDWEEFSTEALRLWRLYRDYAQPHDIARLGLRFINRIECSLNDLRLEDYLRDCPQPPAGFVGAPFETYLHQETVIVPGGKYAFKRVQTIQRPGNQEERTVGLILDVDVFTTKSRDLNEVDLLKMLPEMRWLKNKVFFGSLTEEFLKRCIQTNNS
jgi:uncharacterized protein (TIGR04255 family)